MASKKSRKKAKKKATGTARSSTVGGIAMPAITFSQQELKQAVDASNVAVAKSLGTTVDKLSPSIKKAVLATTKEAMANRTRTLVKRNVDSSVKQTVLAGTSPLDMLGARMSAARDGVKEVASNNDVDAILNDTAQLLFKKFNALKNAGFTEDQSFSLVLAEVSGRSARNR
jgi:hypothetical protein